MSDQDLSRFARNWNYPTPIRFGVGRIKELPDACRSLGMARPLLVTDPGLAKLPMVADAVAGLKAAGLAAAMFSDLRPNPVGRNVEDGVAAFRAGGHDGVVAFGGGSALDVGKAVALRVGQKRPIWDFEDVDDWWTRVDPAGMAPVVAVPTTAGTGSEVGRASVITDESTHTKKIIFHPKMMPGIVIADPALTAGLPPHVTAAVGMDALAHCLEAYCAPGFHPMADGIAVEGMRLVAAYLPRAYRDGRDLEARAGMLAAASMGAVAFQKGLGAIHALAHPIGAHFDVHHGLTNAVLMPYVLEFNRPAIEERMERLARWLGLPDPSFGAAMDWVLALRRELDIPHTLAELGVARDAAGLLGREGAKDPSCGGNPIPVGEAELRAIARHALEGELVTA